MAKDRKSNSTRNQRVTSRAKSPKPRANSRKEKKEEPQEFPISHSMLRQIFDSMIECRLWAQSKQFVPPVSEATAVPAALAVKGTDIFAAPADGRTLYPIAHEETQVLSYQPGLIRDSLRELRTRHRHGVALALVTHDDFTTPETTVLLDGASRELLPIVFLVLTDRSFNPSAAITEIDVDGHDAVAVFRVVSEAIRRARNGRGPAVIHAHGATTPLSANSPDNPLARFQAYLQAKGLSTDDIHVLHHE